MYSFFLVHTISLGMTNIQFVERGIPVPEEVDPALSIHAGQKRLTNGVPQRGYSCRIVLKDH